MKLFDTLMNINASARMIQLQYIELWGEECLTEWKRSGKVIETHNLSRNMPFIIGSKQF